VRPCAPTSGSASEPNGRGRVPVVVARGVLFRGAARPKPEQESDHREVDEEGDDVASPRADGFGNPRRPAAPRRAIGLRASAIRRFVHARYVTQDALRDRQTPNRRGQDRIKDTAPNEGDSDPLVRRYGRARRRGGGSAPRSLLRSLPRPDSGRHLAVRRQPRRVIAAVDGMLAPSVSRRTRSAADCVRRPTGCETHG
jgi:hypothetical protein